MRVAVVGPSAASIAAYEQELQPAKLAGREADRDSNAVYHLDLGDLRVVLVLEPGELLTHADHNVNQPRRRARRRR